MKGKRIWKILIRASDFSDEAVEAENSDDLDVSDGEFEAFCRWLKRA